MQCDVPSTAAELLERYRQVSLRMKTTPVIRSRTRSAMQKSISIPEETPTAQRPGRTLKFEGDSTKSVLANQMKLESILYEYSHDICDERSNKQWRQRTRNCNLDLGEQELRKMLKEIRGSLNDRK